MAETSVSDGNSATHSLSLGLHLKHNIVSQMDLLRAQEALLTVIQQSSAKVAATTADQWTTGLVESRLKLLEGYWHTFCDNHIQLLASEEEPVIEYLLGDGYSTAEDNFTRAQGLLFDQRARLSPINSNTPSSSASSVLSEDSTASISLARLPRITLPTFNGDQAEWESFRDLFVDIIHNNTGLGDATKLLFLKTNVEGDAKEALRDYKQSNANDYAPAWEALKSRYDQPKLQVQDHLEALLSLPTLESESASDLQTLLDKLKRHRSQLKALQKPVQHWDDWFIFLASKAMDNMTRRVWEEELGEEERSKGKIDQTFDRLADFLQRRCRTLRSIASTQSNKPEQRTSQPAEANSSSNEPYSPMDSTRKSTNSKIKTIRTHATGTSQNRGCPACKEAHYIGHCFTFRGLNPDEKRRLVAERGLCFNCLSSNHIARNCPSQTTCRTCAETHHTLLHDGSNANKRPNSAAISDGNPKQPRLQVAATATSMSDVQTPSS